MPLAAAISSTPRYVLTDSVATEQANGITASATSRMSTSTNAPASSAPSSASSAAKPSSDAPLETASSTSRTRRPATLAPRTGGSSTSWPRYPGFRTKANGTPPANETAAASGTPPVSAPTTTSTPRSRADRAPRAPRSRSRSGSAYALSNVSGWIGVRPRSQQPAPGRTTPGAVTSRAASAVSVGSVGMFSISAASSVVGPLRQQLRGLGPPSRPRRHGSRGHRRHHGREGAGHDGRWCHADHHDSRAELPQPRPLRAGGGARGVRRDRHRRDHGGRVMTEPLEYRSSP